MRAGDFEGATARLEQALQIDDTRLDLWLGLAGRVVRPARLKRPWTPQTQPCAWTPATFTPCCFGPP